jgi:translation initiation factor 4E
VRPSSLTLGSDYYVFKEGIAPSWKDPQNVGGGRNWTYVDGETDDMWLTLLIHLLGGEFGKLTEHICGVAVNICEKHDKVTAGISILIKRF